MEWNKEEVEGRENRQETQLQRLREFRLIDDEFLTKAFEDNIPCVEVVLRTILDREDLSLKRVQTQYVIKNLQGRSVRLDVFAEESAILVWYDLEVQRDDKQAGPMRARHNAGMLDANALLPGDDVKSLPETYVIFITEHDVLGKGEPIYRIDRTINRTTEPFEDRMHVIYVNGECRDETPLGLLMQDFFCTDPAEMNNPVLAERVNYLKNTEEGVRQMSKIMEELCDEARAEGHKEGHKEGVLDNQRQVVRSMLRNKLSLELISDCTGMSVAEVREMQMAQ